MSCAGGMLCMLGLQGVVSNLLGMVEQHGFMPNGLRSYFLHRSQPPLLSQASQE